MDERALAVARGLQSYDCTVQPLRNEPVRQPGGALVDNWVDDGAPLRGRISPISSSEPLVQGRPEQRSTAYIVLPHTDDVADDARVRVVHDTEGWVRTFSIIGRRSPRSNQIVTKLVGEEVG